jgi:hypothetical protein
MDNMGGEVGISDILLWRPGQKFGGREGILGCLYVVVGYGTRTPVGSTEYVCKKANLVHPITSRYVRTGTELEQTKYVHRTDEDSKRKATVRTGTVPVPGRP